MFMFLRHDTPNLCNALGSSSRQEDKFHSFTCTLSDVIGQAVTGICVLIFKKILKGLVSAVHTETLFLPLPIINTQRSYIQRFL